MSNSEAATGGIFSEKVFLEISQNSQENTSEFCEISKNTFFIEHLRETASANCQNSSISEISQVLTES